MRDRVLPASTRADLLVGVGVFLLVAVPLTYWFGGWVFPDRECVDSGSDCDFNRSGGFVTGFAALLLTAAAAVAWDRARERRDREYRDRFGVSPQAEVAPWYARYSFYLIVAVGTAVVSFAIGGAHFEGVYCSSPDFDGECDLGPVEGIAWGFTAIVLTAAAAIAYEIVLIRRRWRRRR